MAYREVSIIGNPKGNAWDFCESIYNLVSQRSKDYDLNKIDMKAFPDGEGLPQIERNVRNKDCFFIHDSSEDPSRWLVEIALVNDALKRASAHNVIDVLPYMRFARQDRRDKPRVPVSTRVVADIIELKGDKVISLDIHNSASEGCYNIPFENLYSFPTLLKYLKEKHPTIIKNSKIMSPDTGGAPRARAFANKLGQKDIVIGNKIKDETRKIKGDLYEIVGDVRGKDIFVIDDIVDSAGTLNIAAGKLKKLGANKLYAYATHPLFTKGTEEISKNYDLIFVGDTVKYNTKEKNLEVISFAPLIAEAIFRMCEKGFSLSELFK